MKCGCTMQAPNCVDGGELFAAFIAAKHALERGPGGGENLVRVYRHAEHVYADHVTGRREGDIKVRRDAGAWVLERRQQGQWSLWFGVSGERSFRAWLKTQGFWRYAQIEDDQPRDRLTGYYHQRSSPPDQERRTSAGRTPALQQRGESGFASSPGSEPVTIPHIAPVTVVDLHMQVALLIALLVARIPRLLTVVDRLSVQRKATQWLLSHGELGIQDAKMVERLICEAIRLRDMLEHRERT